MTSLEALNDIIDELKWCCNDGKTLRKYDETRVKVIEKSLKALEIIKFHHFSFDAFNLSSNAIDYNSCFINSMRWITQEQYDLLKEEVE